jgi:hypothetical protein
VSEQVIELQLLVNPNLWYDREEENFIAKCLKQTIVIGGVGRRLSPSRAIAHQFIMRTALPSK